MFGEANLDKPKRGSPPSLRTTQLDNGITFKTERMGT